MRCMEPYAPDHVLPQFKTCSVYIPPALRQIICDLMRLNLLVFLVDIPLRRQAPGDTNAGANDDQATAVLVARFL